MTCKYPKYSDQELLAFDPFEGDRDVDVKLQTSKIVTVRKSHPCMDGNMFGASPHDVKPGEKARCESAIVEGHWRSYYICVPCMEKWLDQINN